jgi:glyoxylase-like metal-dependent hydrolase (beta-lactamase superfamily II)
VSEKAWDEPGVEQVLDGVFRIPLPLPNDGLRGVNVYAIAEGDGLVVIDAGWALAESLERLERGLASIDYKLADIREFLVTHAHRDHYTQAITLRRLFGTKVQIGAGERSTLEILISMDRRPFETMLRRLENAGASEIVARYATESGEHNDPPMSVWELPDSWLTPGEVTLNSRTLEVIETPGHTAGHVVFYDRGSAALFAGDHVLPRITPSIGLEPGYNNLPLAAYLDSLRLVRELPDAKLLPAHGPVTDSVHARVDELLAHHERRLTLSAAAVEGGASTAYEVAQILRWTRHEWRLDELDLFNQTLAIGETRVHLDVCVVRGWLSSTIDPDGVIRYQRA